MKVVVDVSLDGISIDDIVDLARTVGCPIEVGRSYMDVVRWMIRQYGRSLVSKVERFIAEQAELEDRA